MTRIRWTLTLALLVFAASCKKDATAPPPTVTGTWAGFTGSQKLTITITENAGTVGGSGTITNTSTGTRALSITGSWSRPTLSITFSSGTAQPFNLTANLNPAGTNLAGPLNGSGFSGEVMSMTRQ